MILIQTWFSRVTSQLGSFYWWCVSPASLLPIAVRHVLIDSKVAAIVPAIIVAILRVYLAIENKRRDRLESENAIADNGIIERINADGSTETQVVDANQLDLTDRQNLKL